MNDVLTIQSLFAGCETPYGTTPITFDQRGAAQLKFNDQLTLNLQIHRPTRQLILYMLLGPLPEIKRREVLIYAMSANLTQYAADGIFVALEPNSQILVLKQLMRLEDLATLALRASLATLKDRAETWRTKLQVLVCPPDALDAAPQAAAAMAGECPPSPACFA